MTSRFVQLYAALFFTDQLFGIAFAMAGSLAPAIHLAWSASLGALALGTAAILCSLALPVVVQLRHLPPVLHLLPIYHLGGLLVLESVIRSEARLVQSVIADLPPAALKAATLHGPDVFFAALVHSCVGLVLGIHVIWIADSPARAAGR